MQAKHNYGTRRKAKNRLKKYSGLDALADVTKMFDSQPIPSQYDLQALLKNSDDYLIAERSHRHSVRSNVIKQRKRRNSSCNPSFVNENYTVGSSTQLPILDSLDSADRKSISTFFESLVGFVNRDLVHNFILTVQVR